MLIKSWEKKVGKHVYYINLYKNQFVIGDYFSDNHHTDNAGTCTIEQFSEGKFQNLVLQYFGKEVLTEIKELCN